MSTIRTISAEDAIGQLAPTSRIVAAPGCGTPETLLAALAVRAADLQGPVLYSGLQLGTYPFLDSVARGEMRYRTWHPFGLARKFVDAGQADYIPARASAIPSLLDVWGTDAALIRVTPPDRNGWCNLGPSASYIPQAISRANIVIAEVDPSLPRTTGASMVHISQVSLWVDSLTPMCEFPPSAPDELSRSIAGHVISVMPHEPTIQVGIGAIPEAVTDSLANADIGVMRVVGMATDSMVDLFDAGALAHTDTGPEPAVLAAELMGTHKLMRFADGNPSIVLAASGHAHNPMHLARRPRLVTINSAIEVDLFGQVSSEYVGKRHISGIGGSADFFESAHGSTDGLSIVAMTSTTPDGSRGRIVRHINAPTISIARHSPDVVVTEFGVAWLRGRTEAQRAEELLNICHPDHLPALP